MLLTAKSFKSIRILHWGIIAWPLVMAFMSYYQIYTYGVPRILDLENPILILPIGFAVVFIPLSSFVFNRFLNFGLKGKTTLKEKLTAFQTAHLIKLAMLEVVALSAVVVCMVTYTTINYLTLCLPIVIMILATPSVEQLKEKLQLTKKEAGQLS